MQGRVVQQSSQDIKIPDIDLDISHLKAGFYYIMIISKDYTVSRRLVKV